MAESELDRLREFARHCIESFEEDDPSYPYDKGYRAKGRFVAKWAYKALTGKDGTYEDIKALKESYGPRFVLRTEFFEEDREAARRALADSDGT